MGTINETVRTFNSVARTLLFAVLLVGAGLVGWKGYSLYYQPRELLEAKQLELEKVLADLQQAGVDLEQRDRLVESLEQDLSRTTAELEQARTAMRLLKMRRRIAHIHVVDQSTDPNSERVVSKIEFYEVSDDGTPIDGQRRTFEIEGDRVYVECLVAKFEDKYIEEAALDRSTAICLFQRIFGEYQNPQDGYLIDTSGTSPTSYARGGEMSEFEKQIWHDFWEIANDRSLATELGIRAAHAQAPSTKVVKGGLYELELRSTGEFTLQRI